MSLTYGSVCSGIEAATQAWHPLGWKPAFFSEIDNAARAVLTHHYPDVPLHGDFTSIKADQYDPIDLLVGGTPCQSFSIAGLRGGLGDDRGNLALEFLKLAARKRARWVVWENVPGVFSSLSHDAPDQRPPAVDLDGDDGPEVGEEIVVTDEYDADENHALACFLAGLSELGYGWAYRVLDAQHTRTCSIPFAVPQRRRRIIVVGYIGDWRRAAAVLFDRQSLQGDPAPRREAGKGSARGFECGPASGGFTDVAPTLDTRCKDGPIRNQLGAGVIQANSGDASYCLTASAQQSLDAETETLIASVSGSGATHSLTAEGFDASGDDTGRGTPIIAFDTTQITSKANFSNPKPGDPCHPLAAGAHPPAAAVKGERYADAYEADTSSALSTLRETVGAKSYTEWGLRILAALQSPEVLRAWLHGESIRGQAKDFQSFVGDGALSFSEDSAGRTLRKLWEVGPDGRSPQGRGLAKQLAGKPGEALSVLPQQEAPVQINLQVVREAREGSRILRKALSEMEEVGRPARRQDQPEHSRWAVRRLTPREAERLQGFPDDFTRIPWRGKPAEQCPDGQRYKQCGNSMAVNVMEWIGERIQLIEDISKEHPA